MTDQPIGIHHVTAITDDAMRNYKFFTEVLGMRLVKKTVNQDDIHTYHTFFADDEGSPGTDMTFFDFPGIPQGVRGTNSISRVGFRVPDDAALEYYLDRFKKNDVKNEGIRTLFGKKALPFEEADGQRYQLFSDENNEGVASGKPWKEGPVPADKAIYGLGPVEITVSYFDEFKQILFDVYGMRLNQETEDVALIETGEGGNGGQVILRKDTGKAGMEGYGQVHHVSFRVKDHEAIKQWENKYDEMGLRHSGLVDRFYFEALYTRIGNILVELSTDGPGFMGDEPYETLGESLSLPPFLEPQRDYIESQIKPFDTTRS
ncbi:MAG: ring-cleaving dioxygenase [Alkalibacterium gilvum]|uniref:Glyoxalase family protein n=1 Tax=Alkalibacterium gilvum TaxID=1130080 RepID=A0A1H6U1J4_9LACT|nr:MULTISPECIES: ring-cleaving dioxygenase [Alkalibacterium]MDN6293919.1 ring-cleaving dioxygenase [Alkalibacterium sp.]MDN6295761.1 ring-cleaving dioxygenase [Alkalibacterium sp.]MDN6398339.1 ring-cleaving dioxygenase [Alkalibacterium sp.]MDN6729447.1 ring-cleaving dioxygenase [Alkalibacterium sp.]SEI86228.1 glyoxalase family protein [Alkalibacterium gilvum]